MKDIPANLGGFRLMVTEEPQMKMRENAAGEQEPVVDRDGVAQFVVMLFAKARPRPGVRSARGEEIKVNLAADPGEGLTEGTYVELINPVINTFEIPDKDDPRKIAQAGIWFKADGLKPLHQQVSDAA
ncbi:MAG: hypothetical protein GEU97_24155 [Actinophytocola sp.]|nr:hypothetical protein [Actinophytocola sp.]